jgi:hypothetical protein
MQQQYSTNTSRSHAKQSRDRQITDRSKAQQRLQREKRGKKEFHQIKNTHQISAAAAHGSEPMS